MGISPMRVGDLLPVIVWTLTKDDGTAFDATNATMSLVINNRSTGADTTGAGSWSAQGVGTATYTWAAPDTATAGDFDLYPRATIAGKQITFDSQYIKIVAT